MSGEVYNFKDERIHPHLTRLNHFLHYFLQSLLLLTLLIVPLVFWKIPPLELKNSVFCWLSLLILSLMIPLYFKTGAPLPFPKTLRSVPALLILWFLVRWISLQNSVALPGTGWLLPALATAFFYQLSIALTDDNFRSKALLVVLGSLFCVGSVALCMYFGIYFYYFQPIDVPTETARHTVAATIGHNASVASLMMSGVFLALAGLFHFTHRIVKLFTGFCLILFLFVIAVSATVAVWLILPFLLIILLFIFYRYLLQQENENKKHFFIRTAISLILSIFLINVFIFSLSPNWEKSPFARIERLRGDYLLKGARLRLWRISLSMIQDHPLGVGFGAFAEAYPEFQGRYFEHHPDSPLHPTSLRPLRAHNDFLEVAVETGWPGLFLMLWLLFVFVKFVRIHFTQQPKDNRLEYLLFSLAAFGTVLHSLVAFELQVIPTAMILLFSLAWLFSSGQTQYALPSKPAEAPAWLAPLFAIGLYSIFSPILTGIFQSEVFFHRGHQFRQTGFFAGQHQLKQQQLDFYRQSEDMFKQALATTDQRAEKRKALLWTKEQIAKLYSEAGNEDKAGEHLTEAQRRMEQDNQFLPHPDELLIRAEIWERLSKLEKAEASYRNAAWVNPRDLHYAFQLGRFYLETGQKEKAVQTWRGASQKDSKFLEQQLVLRGHRLLAQAEAEQAWAIARIVQEVSPEFESGVILAWESALQLEDQQKVKTTLEMIRRQLRENQVETHLKEFLVRSAEYALFQEKDYERALDNIDQLLEIYSNLPHGFFLKSHALEALGQTQEAESLLESKIQSLDELNADTWVLIHRLYHLKRKQYGIQTALQFLDKMQQDPRIVENSGLFQRLENLRRFSESG